MKSRFVGIDFIVGAMIFGLHITNTVREYFGKELFGVWGLGFLITYSIFRLIVELAFVYMEGGSNEKY